MAQEKRELIDNNTRHLAFSAFTFDISITDIFTPLAFGGTVCMPSEHEKMNDLVGCIQRMEVNHMVTVPTVAAMLSPEQIPGVKALITGGEAMPQEFINIWADKLTLINTYGPAEVASRCTSTVKKPGDRGSTIGTGLGAVCWVTRSHDPTRLVPIGAVGELVVEGAILASGYLKNETKTREAFIDAPEWHKEAFPDRHPCKLYRTGDLVIQQPDGSFDYLGRRDTQIKVHGVRLEPGAIEYKIRQELPEGAEVVVDKVTVGQEPPKQMLAAFVTLPGKTFVSAEGTQLLPADDEVRDFVCNLHSRLVKALPSYMVPNYILPINNIPVGATNKVNRRGLKALAGAVPMDQLNQYSGLSGGRGGTRKPETKMEVALSKIWAEVLSISEDTICADDSFFGLSGDSVQAMQSVNIATAAGISLSVASIFEHPVLSELATFLAGDSRPELTTLEPIEEFELIGGAPEFRKIRDALRKTYKIQGNRVDDVYPAVPIQEGMMAESILSPEAYMLQEVFKLGADVDMENLETAIETFFETHSMLRTRIVRLKDFGTCQVVMAEDEIAEVNKSQDLAAFLAEDRENHMEYGDALTRFALIDEPNGAKFLVWTIHHAITDGQTHLEFLKRLETIYNGREPPETVPYNQFVKYVDLRDSEESRIFWEQQFSGGLSQTYPECDDEDYEAAITDYHELRFKLPKSGSRFTSSILLRAAWSFVLSKALASDDVVLGVTQAGRDIPLSGIHTTLGPVLTTIPVRIAIDSNDTVQSFLAKVQKQYINQIPHQHYGLKRIRQASEETAEASVFRNLLVVQPADDFNSKLFTRTGGSNDDALNFGFLLECFLGVGEMTMRVGFDKNLVPSDEASRLGHCLNNVFQQLVQNANTTLPLSAIDVDDTTPVEQSPTRDPALDYVSTQDLQILNGFNPEVKPLEQCMHWMIEEQARRQPNAPMIDSWDAQLTYKEANNLSDRLAGHLVQLGVGPEVIVPFAFEKSAWATIAIHGILKAGGCCVALDVAHPRARHEKIIADTGAKVIVASTQHAQSILDLGLEIVQVDRKMLERLRARPQSTRVKVSPSNPAWVVYSSGSTGLPKGSILEHRSLCSTSRTNSEILGVGPSTRAIHFASYSFDVAIEENTIIPMYGGCVCIPSDEERLDDLAGALTRLQVNWADLTPTVGRMLNPQNTPTLRTLVLGGESLTKDIIDTWAGKINLFNTYGPSECSIQCTSSLSLKQAATGANIGRPVNCKL